MKPLYLLLGVCICGLFQLFVTPLHSQTYHPMPTGPARWDISRCWYFYPAGWHDLYYIEMDGSDTLLYGQTYKKLYHTTHHLPGTQFDSTYTHFLGGMREENKQVFMVSEYLCLDTMERMIYDFNPVSAGDTVYTQVLTNGPGQFIPHIVTSVDAVMVDGVAHRRIHLRDENDFFAESWIEGVGSVLGLPYASYWLLTDNSYDLHCFYGEGQLHYMNDAPAYGFCTPPFPDGECEPVITSPGEDPEEVRYVIYPNPVYGTLYIDGTAAFASAEVYNTIGQKVMEVTFAPEIPVDGLAAGLYLLRLQTREGQIPPIEKFIKL